MLSCRRQFCGQNYPALKSRETKASITLKVFGIIPSGKTCLIVKLGVTSTCWLRILVRWRVRSRRGWLKWWRASASTASESARLSSLRRWWPRLTTRRLRSTSGSDGPMPSFKNDRLLLMLSRTYFWWGSRGKNPCNGSRKDMMITHGLAGWSVIYYYIWCW